MAHSTHDKLTLWRPLLPYGLSVRVSGCQKLQITA